MLNQRVEIIDLYAPPGSRRAPWPRGAAGLKTTKKLTAEAVFMTPWETNHTEPTAQAVGLTMHQRDLSQTPLQLLKCDKIIVVSPLNFHLKKQIESING